MAFSDTEQAEMMNEVRTHSAFINDLAPIDVEFNTSSEPVFFGDGSVEAGKPYCIATSKDVTDYGIQHGTALTIDGVSWYVIGVQLKRSGFYNLTVSRTL